MEGPIHRIAERPPIVPAARKGPHERRREQKRFSLEEPADERADPSPLDIRNNELARPVGPAAEDESGARVDVIA